MPAIKRPRSFASGGGPVKKKKKPSYSVVTYKKTPLGVDHNLLRTSQQATMRYADRFTLAATTSAPDYRFMSANGMYDPDITGIGHQPRGFDELMKLYDRFQVDEVEIECTFSQSWSTTNGAAVHVGIALIEDSSVRLTDIDYVESRICDSTVMVGQNAARTLRLTVKPNEFLGLPKRGEHGLTGSAGTNPLYQCFFHIWAVGVTGGAMGNMNVNTKLTFKVNLTEPKEPLAS